MTGQEKMEKDIRRTKALGWLVVVIFGLALLFLLGSVGVMSWQYEQQHSFDSVAWMTGGPVRRGEMLEDLLSGHTLVGMTREEVTGLLGAGISSEVLGTEDALVYQTSQDTTGAAYLVLMLSGDTVVSVEEW